MTPEWMRPATAAAHFDVSERTLSRWADGGLIGHARQGRAIWYLASDIADVIAAGATPRTVVPITPSTPAAADESWREHRLWSKAR